MQRGFQRRWHLALVDVDTDYDDLIRLAPSTFMQLHSAHVDGRIACFLEYYQRSWLK